MAQTIKVPIPPDGKIVEGIEIPIVETIERWTEVKLEDGSTLRIRPSVVTVIWIPGQFDHEGNPMYALKAATTMVVANAPEKLRRQDSQSETAQQ